MKLSSTDLKSDSSQLVYHISTHCFDEKSKCVFLLQFFRSSEETLITQWLFFRYMMVGIYVGIATVGGATYWFLYDPTGPQMSYYQLSNFLQCPAEPEKFKGLSCDIFQVKNFL